MALTTALKVRNRLNIETFQASDAMIAEFIADADGLIRHSLGYIPTASDDKYSLAVSTSTGLAAYYTAMQLPYPEDVGEAKVWMKKVEHHRMVADRNLKTMGKSISQIPVAKSTTEA